MISSRSTRAQATTDFWVVRMALAASCACGACNCFRRVGTQNVDQIAVVDRTDRTTVRMQSIVSYTTGTPMTFEIWGRTLRATALPWSFGPLAVNECLSRCEAKILKRERP